MLLFHEKSTYNICRKCKSFGIVGIILKSGLPVIFFFEGASDNLSTTTKVRTGAVCIVLRWDSSKNCPTIAFYDENSSTLPDFPYVSYLPYASYMIDLRSTPINNNLKFGKLTAKGEYTLVITASKSNGSMGVWAQNFTVK